MIRDFGEKATNHFLKAFGKSYELVQEHMDKIPNGFSRKSFMYGPSAIFADHGEGQYVYTVEGNKLLDFNNNFTVNILGYRHLAVQKAIEEAMNTGYSFGNPTGPEYELAEILAERISAVEKVKFFCSSSEACLRAMRIARGYTGKSKVAKFEGSYHGFGDETSISGHVDPSLPHGTKERPNSVPDSAGIPISAVGGSSEVMAVRGYYPVVRGQIALTLPMTDDDITGFIETSKELIESIYQ